MSDARRPEDAHTLGQDARRALLSTARASLETHLGLRPEGLRRPGIEGAAHGVFVTLRRHGQLRGCIGLLEPPRDLSAAVADCAVAAATDPRFTPLSRDELAETRIEISVLGKPERIHGPGEIEIGRHGLLVSQGGRRGLLLPQVPLEQQWDSGRFLREACRKAGIPPEAWRSGAAVDVFTAEVFGEEDTPAPAGPGA